MLGCHDRFVFTDGGRVVDALSNDSRFSLWIHSEPVKDRMQMRQSIFEYIEVDCKRQR